ncbi:MAG: NnrS family protein [Gammaproteobacteria bacterium]|nr:NnrS family protein [Gammaproteobacteria bacterium]
MVINIKNNQTAQSISTVFRLAFRPLFLGGTLFAVLAISWWIYFWIKPGNWMPHGGPLWWHSHEMLFGFGAAIAAGFLLTAVASWTGVSGIRGKPLAVLVFSWFLARLLLAFDFGLADWIIAMVDVSFLLFVSIAMAYPIIKVKQWRNLMFIPILLALTGFNAISHWAVLNNQYSLTFQYLHATIMLFTLLIAVLGGRVIPAFTANTTGCIKALPVKWIETASIISLLLMVVFAFIGYALVPSILLFVVSSTAAIVNFVRFSRWGIQHTQSIPLLWSLHLSYIFIPIGFVLLALHGIGLIDNVSAALHCFTIGSIGGMILAMISRISLGHTGRPLKINSLISVAYVAVLLAALIRVMIPLWLPEFYSLGIGVSGGLWILAFSIYLYFYAPMLVKPRVDGQPG